MYMLLICLHTCTYQLLTSILQKDAMLEELQRKVESFEQDKDSCVMEVCMYVYMYVCTYMCHGILNKKPKAPMVRCKLVQCAATQGILG